LPVDATGRLDSDDLRSAITPRTILISVMHANNEVGTIQSIAECARIAHEHGVLFHTDAAQSVGKVPTDVNELGVDLLSIAGHKLYAPKGIGALFVRRGVALEPLIRGAGHEGGRRAGTESALLAVGLGKACELARDLTPMDRIRTLREHFWQNLQKKFGNRVAINGHPTHRLPNTLNVSFVGQVGAEILARLDGLAASTGSACHSGRIELSPVLEAMGVTPEVGIGAVRFSLGRSTTRDEIDTVVERLINILAIAGCRRHDQKSGHGQLDSLMGIAQRIEGLTDSYARWRSSRLRRITDALERQLLFELLGPAADKTLLDVGCGDGELASELARRGAIVTGLDADPTMIAAARRRTEIEGTQLHLVDGQAERLPFDDAVFDRVVAVTVLCFVRDAERAVAEMARVLKPGGLLVIGELGRWSLWATHRRIRGWLGDPIWRAAMFRTAAELRAFVEAASLKMIEFRGTAYYPPCGIAAGLLAPADPWLGRMTTVGAAFIVVSAEKAIASIGLQSH
jgi:ubiquinone/menaquinone biosynthesis C-methylase UbiE